MKTDEEKRQLKNQYNKEYSKQTKHAAQSKFKKNNIKRTVIDLHNENDADIIAKLASEKNRQGYLKQLIRDDIKNSDIDHY